jgi:hypothetical protein
MPFYYDVSRSETSNASAGSTSTHFYALTVAEQETCAIKAVYIASRFGTAGGAQLRLMGNTGTVASGGTAFTPSKRNMRGNPAAQTTWFDDNTAITPGGTLVQRLSIGFAQTGGMGGWVPVEPSDSIQMMANGANPIDLEFVSVANAAAVTFDMTVEFSEGT